LLTRPNSEFTESALSGLRLLIGGILAQECPEPLVRVGLSLIGDLLEPPPSPVKLRPAIRFGRFSVQTDTGRPTTYGARLPVRSSLAESLTSSGERSRGSRPQSRLAISLSRVSQNSHVRPCGGVVGGDGSPAA